MRIAMLGTRGIPSSYSGFETCVEQLGARLVERGHSVRVYCRSHHMTTRVKVHRGMELVYLPTIRNKYTDTLVHTLLSALHVALFRCDAVLMFNVGNSVVSWIPRLAGEKVALNVDGLDWQRDKWPGWAKAYIRLSERLATWFPNAIISDSEFIEEYYRQKYGKASVRIAYGSDQEKAPPGRYLAQFGVEPRKYVLFVGRLVPENCPHHLVDAFTGLDTSLKCVIVGDAPYEEAYIQRLKESAAPSVVFTGYLFGEGYRELGSNAYVFVESSAVGGTHPALLEAMAFGNCVVVNDTPANLEVIADAGLSYAGSQGAAALRDVLRYLIAHPGDVERYRGLAEARAGRCYSWDAVTTRYEALCESLVRGNASGSGR